METDKDFRAKGLWQGSQAVSVKGVPTAESFTADTPAEEKERIIQSWNTIAVLETNTNSPFRVGFMRGEDVWILNAQITTSNGNFGMRVGKDDLQFFAIDSTFEKPVQLSLVEVIKEGDERYSNLPIY